MMKNTYLEVTFRHGRPIAAYYYLGGRARRAIGPSESLRGWWWT